jgi:hypothetical protein
MSEEKQFPVEHAVDLDIFLKSPAGQSLMNALRFRRPDIGNAQTIEQQALVSREARGWEKCLEELVSISQERPREPMGNGFLDMSNDKPKPE